MEKELWFIHIPKCAGTSIKEALDIDTGHQTLKSMKHSMCDEYWNNSFSFSFVRNPYNRMASLYKFYRKELGGGFDEQIVSFREWIYLTLVAKAKPYYIREEYFKPCFDWISLDGKSIDVDFVGKVENIDEDFRDLCNTLDIEATLDTHNSTYGSVYYTEDMREIVREHFKKDIELWYN